MSSSFSILKFHLGLEIYVCEFQQIVIKNYFLLLLHLSSLGKY